jgi:hypothetical protein
MSSTSGVAQLIKAEQRANAMVKDIRLQRHQKMEEAKTKARQLGEDERLSMMSEIDAQRAVVSWRGRSWVLLRSGPARARAHGGGGGERVRAREDVCICIERGECLRRVLTRFLLLSLALGTQKLDGEKDRVKGELMETLEREKAELQGEYDTNVERTVALISKFVCQVKL